jgi:peptidoglycan/xylan/chitin deacetylase (PgdA/CDA1 family)
MKTIRQVGRMLRSRFSERAWILGYHRIAPVVSDPYRTCVSPGHFAEHLEVLKERAQPISLSNLLGQLKDGRVPHKCFVLTFDDGYADVQEYAIPLLERYEFPASVFVANGYLGKIFWWDRLEAAIRNQQSPMERLNEVCNTNSEEKGFPFLSQRYEGGRSGDQMDMIISYAYRKFLVMNPNDRDRAIDTLEAKMEITEPTRHRLPRVMSANQIAELAGEPLIEIGSHSTSHPLLENLSIAEQYREISGSKSILEEILGKPVTSFSYPNGSLCKDTVRMVERAGYRCACTSFKDVVRRKSDPYKLPRFWPSDVNGDIFQRWLMSW